MTLHETNIPRIPMRRGKVRDVYDYGDSLVIVATDRISAFDYILPTAIPDKGRILTQMTQFWLPFLGVPNHLISANVGDFPEEFQPYAKELEGRSMWVCKTNVVPFECVARGYLAGSAWKEYQKSGTVCGIPLPAGLRESEALPEPIFTPATKAESGHDENVSFEVMASRIGTELAEELRDKTLLIYRRAAQYARMRNIIIADTKLEWGQLQDGEVLLIDEVLTPDSSRFWDTRSYTVGQSPPSFDKQFVRDWLENCGWDKNSPPPPLPDDVVEKTAAKYAEALQRLTTD